MLHRINLLIRAQYEDAKGLQLLKRMDHICPTLSSIRTLDGYLFESTWSREDTEILAKEVLQDPIFHQVHIGNEFGSHLDFDWYVEIGFRPGVTDNAGRTAREAFAMRKQWAISTMPPIHSIKGFFFRGQSTKEQIEEITHQILMNDLIERATIIPKNQWNHQQSNLMTIPKVAISQQLTVETFAFQNVTELLALSKARTLALSAEESEVILGYFANKETQEKRCKAGIHVDPTDVELEILAQTWSEHCKHKIFNAEIDYTDATNQKQEIITSLYKTYIQGSTEHIRAELGENDWCISVFSDNAGVIRFNEEWNIAMKVETHNSPSALDPYGGALTGIVGVNRDIFGTGLGAEMIFNTDVFCFASPHYDREIPPKLMHPSRIMEGVRLGVEHGGNKSGIPTVNGAVVFHERFLGKPLVFCGTGGIMPSKLQGQPSHEKTALSGDVIVMVGGRIGKDGIHGATFSSEALHEESPATAVQIGDPIVQKRMFDFLLEARNQGMYRCITDNGAGGLSSSVGEMATFSNGAHVELEKAPVKYAGLQPWEIFISEAQERMTLAVKPECLSDFLQLSEAMGVESSAIGTFNNSGFLEVTYEGELVAYLDLEFLHNGVPRMKLKAHWIPPTLSEPQIEVSTDFTPILKSVLAQLNICSKESIIRQYDHEVQGGSVIKPLVGIANDGPSDAAVIRPLLHSMEGVGVSNGICPRYSDIDTYHMMTNAIDEAVRNLIAVGGSLDHIAGLDNFCWCDPIATADHPQGEYKLAQLVRACQALYDLTTLYGVPCISGKDSMKNDYRHQDLHIAIPPTVLFSVIGKIEDIRKTVSMDAKSAGDLVYVLGETKNELGGSEYYQLQGEIGANVPQVDGISAKKRYRTVSEAMQQGWIRSCHDCSDGGLATALAEVAFAGGLGMELDISTPVETTKLRVDQYLFSETPSRFVITVSPPHREQMEHLFSDQVLEYLGTVSPENTFRISANEKVIVSASIQELKTSWQQTLENSD